MSGHRESVEREKRRYCKIVKNRGMKELDVIVKL